MSYLNILPEDGSLCASKVHYVSSGKFENDWESLPHLHRFSELMLITDGDGYFVAEQKFYAIKKGDLILVPACVMHTEVSGKVPLAYRAVGFTDNLFEKSVAEKFIYKPRTADYSQLFNCLEALQIELARKYDKHERLFENYLNNIIILTERITKKDAELKSTEVAVPKLQEVIEYMDHNYSKDISLSELCSAFFISKTHLIRLFKENTGHTPIEYLLRRKTQAAMTLLLTTDLSVMQIAMVLNFPSSSYFIMKFKKYVGETPYKYRTKHRRS